MCFEVNDRVLILPGTFGKIYRVRLDSGNELIYTIQLDDPGAHPYGLYYARRWDLVCDCKECHGDV